MVLGLLVDGALRIGNTLWSRTNIPILIIGYSVTGYG